MHQKEDLEGIINTFADSQEFLGHIPEMMSLEVEDEKEGVECSG